MLNNTKFLQVTTRQAKVCPTVNSVRCSVYQKSLLSVRSKKVYLWSI